MLSPETYLAAIRRDAELLAAAAGLGLHAKVPNCPGWDVATLVEHTGLVHRHKIQIIEEGWLEGSPDWERPPARRRLVSWFEAGARHLVDVLGSKQPDQPISTWDSGNETIGFWYRRMAQETFIHRIDAEQSHGIQPELDTSLAGDGIAELLSSFMGNAPAWADVSPTDQYVLLDPSDTSAQWNVRLAVFSGVSPRTGIRYKDELLTTVEPVRELNASSAHVRGPASLMDMWLWGRSRLDALAVVGERETAEKLRAIAAQSTT